MSEVDRIDIKGTTTINLDGLRRRSSVRRIAVGFASLTSVVAIGASAYRLQGWSWGDAWYMVIITVSTVGYGEVRPVASTWERVVTVFVILAGMFASAYTIAGFLQLVTEQEIRQLLGHQRVRKQIDSLHDHVLIAGFGRMGSLICEQLASAGVSFVVLERDPTKFAEIERKGYLGVLGEATEESILLDAGLRRAKAIVTAVPSDAASVFITLTVRQLAPHVQIIARAEMPSSQSKLVQAGANNVVLPAAIGAQRIAAILTRPGVIRFSELVAHDKGLAIDMDEVPVSVDGSLAHKTLRDLDIGRRTGVVVIAVKRADGRVEFPPVGDEALAVGDALILLGRQPNLAHFRRHYQI